MNAALKREAELHEQGRRASKAALMLSGEATALKTQIAQGERERDRMLVEEARTGKRGDSDALGVQLDSLRAKLADTEVRAEAAARASKQVREELTSLRRQHFATFLDQRLDPISVRAIDKLLSVESSLREARQAWDELTSAWAPFHPALREHVQESNAARGRYESGSAVETQCRVPSFPQLDDLSIFESIRRGGFSAHPPALRVQQPSPIEISDATDVEIS